MQFTQKLSQSGVGFSRNDCSLVANLRAKNIQCAASRKVNNDFNKHVNIKQNDASRRSLFNLQAQDQFMTPSQVQQKEAEKRGQEEADKKVMLGEFFATALLNYMASSVAFAAGALMPGFALGKILACGLGTSVLFMVIFYTFQPICGCLLNPTVTLSLWVGQLMKTRLALTLIAVQALGAWAGNYIYLLQLPLEKRVPEYIGASMVANNQQAILSTFIGEFMGSFILVTAVYGHILDKRGVNTKVAAVTIGLTLAILTFMLAPISGACFNPTRVLGLGIVSGYFDKIWIYWVAPLLGGTLAAFVHKKFFKED